MTHSAADRQGQAGRQGHCVARPALTQRQFAAGCLAALLTLTTCRADITVAEPATRGPAGAIGQVPPSNGPSLATGGVPATSAVIAAPSAAAASSPGATLAAAPAGAQAAAPSAEGAAPAEDIRDIRGPKLGISPWVVAAVLAAAALLALAVVGWRRWRARRQERVLLPFERALAELDQIRPLMQPASAREFCIAVSDIVRRYIEQRFDVTATHRTTEEFLHDVLTTATPSLARHGGLLAEFLQQCDLVKFAGMSLALPSIEALYDRARGFVMISARPDPAPRSEHVHDTLPAT